MTQETQNIQRSRHLMDRFRTPLVATLIGATALVGCSGEKDSAPIPTGDQPELTKADEQTSPSDFDSLRKAIADLKLRSIAHDEQIDKDEAEKITNRLEDEENPATRTLLGAKLGQHIIQEINDTQEVEEIAKSREEFNSKVQLLPLSTKRIVKRHLRNAIIDGLWSDVQSESLPISEIQSEAGKYNIVIPPNTLRNMDIGHALRLNSRKAKGKKRIELERLANENDRHLDETIGAQSRQLGIKDLTQKANKAYATHSRQLMDMTKTHHQDIEPDTLTDKITHNQPNHYFDFSNIGNRTEKIRIEDVLPGIKPGVYNRIGKVFFDGKSTKLNLDTHLRISNEDKQQLQTIIDKNMALIEASQKSGQLVDISFLVPEEIPEDEGVFNGFHSPDTNQIHIFLPPDQTINTELLSTVLTHELAHALSDYTLAGNNISLEEIDSLDTACTMLRDNAYQQAEAGLDDSIELVEKLIDKAQEQDQKLLFEKLKEKLITQKFDEHTQDFYDNDMSQEYCQPVTLIELLSTIDPSIDKQELADRITKNQDLEALNQKYTDVIYQQSLYRFLKEGSYIASDSKHAPFLGHPNDNAKELVASTISILINHPDQMTLVYTGLDKESKEIMTQAIKTSTRIIASRHPNLRATLNRLQRQVLSPKHRARNRR